MYSLGLDIGSSSIKAVIIDEQGKRMAQEQVPAQEMEIKSPETGWAEQDPETWWQYVCQAIRQVMETSGIGGDSINAIGIAYQMHGLVLIDRDGKVLRPSIIWCDSRAVHIGEKAYRKLGSDFCQQHYLNSPGNFTAAKLAWVKENEPDVYKKIYKVLLPGDYIAFRLSGDATTTVAGLSEGIMWDFYNRDVAYDLLQELDLEHAQLADQVPVFGATSTVNTEAASLTGLLAGTPIAYRAGDQPNNALSLGVLHPGQVAATAGTSGVIYGVTTDPQSDVRSRVNYFAHVNYSNENPNTGLLLCINGTGILHSWMRKLIGTDSYERMEVMASDVNVGSDGIVMLPFGNGVERLFDNRPVGAHMLNIDFNRHNAGHVVRAGLEGVACAFNYGAKLMGKLGTDTSTIRVGNDNLFQSSIFAQTVASLTGSTIDVLETSGADGAAKAARYGAGICNELDDLFRPEPVKTYHPKADERYEQMYKQWNDQLNQLLNSTS